MIYSCYFAGLIGSGHIRLAQEFQYGVSTDADRLLAAKLHKSSVTRKQAFIDFIKKSKGDSFVFITTSDQRPSFKEFLQENDLNKFMTFDSKEPCHNGNHPMDPKRLWVTVLQTKED